MNSASYTVRGMTCDHCVRAVTAAVSELPGVENVDVELADGRMLLTGERLPAVRVLQEAVGRAGYELDAN
jgi:copper chaperone CopZ